MLKPFAFVVAIFAFSCFINNAEAQKVDSLFFNLYTDSLKIGTHNYINVDGKMSDGRYMPLTGKELLFTSTGGTFSGNSLFIDSSFKDLKVVVKITLKSNPSVWKETTIYIKQSQEVEKLRTVDEILNTPPKKKKDKKNNYSYGTVGPQPRVC
ncbi:MAG TPA: hypothetical protein VM012_01230 [Flavitalea sp.]|nr:hypothetical protein [Flavitalea sp.]